MDLQIDGKTCLVTGASAGIGVGIARILAREGVRVAITARRGDRLEALADEIAAETRARPLTVVADLSDPAAAKALKAATDDAFGPLDILVNNAGASRPMGPEASDAEWLDAFDINFDAARRLTREYLPDMQARKWGRVINISGAMEPTGINAGQAASATTHAWAKGLSRDVAADGITVNCIPPGRINSEQILERLHPTEEGRRKFIAENIPIGYFGEPEDVGHLVAFLSSPLASYITGTVIYVDGGMHRFIH